MLLVPEHLDSGPETGPRFAVALDIDKILGYDELRRPLEVPVVPRTPRLPRGVRRASRGPSSPVRCPKFKPRLPVADGDEPRVTPAPNRHFGLFSLERRSR